MTFLNLILQIRVFRFSNLKDAVSQNRMRESIFLSSLTPRRGFEKPLVSVNSNRHHAVFSDSQI